MKKLKINYYDFGKNFDAENHYFTKLLRTKYDVEISDDPDYPHFIGVNVDWLYYVPFPLMLIASRIILGWDLFMPFYAAGIIAITLDAYSKYKAKTLRGTLMIAGAGTASITLFALISLCGGVVL